MRRGGLGAQLSVLDGREGARGRERAVESALMAEITVFDNGPVKVTGGVVLKDMTGKPFNLPNKDQFALCRCGNSSNKPFCDGSHKTTNFQSQVRA